MIGTGDLPSLARTAPRDDAALLALLSGDQSAMAVIYDRYSGLVYSVALRVLRDPAAAEDVIQDVFMRLWRNPESFNADRGSLGSSLAGLARNRSIEMLRRKQPSVLIDDIALVAPGNLEDETERNALMERARAGMQNLSRDLRKPLEMAFFDGLTHSEVADVTGAPSDTVKSRIRSALLSLRKAYQT